MASYQSKVFNVLLRLVNKKDFLKKRLVKGTIHQYSSPWPTGRIIHRNKVIAYLLNGHHVFTIKPKNKGSTSHILYFHGGAYVQSFTRVHWSFLAQLIEDTNCTVTAPDYPLAPKHDYRDTFAMCLKVYERLGTEVKTEHLILMGDSSGGGLALAFAQELKNRNLPQPKQIILLSPWLDLTLSNPAIKELAEQDPFTGIEGLLMAGSAYAGSAPKNLSLLSPINGSLEGLGKISIFVGAKEIMVADARKLKLKAESLGIPLNYWEYSDMVHVWMLLRLPESRAAQKQITDLIVC